MAYGSAGASVIRALASRIAPSVVSVVAYDADFKVLAEGSGFFVAEGRVATSRHLLAGARAARVMKQDGTVHDVLGALAEDMAADVILLGVDIPDRVVPPLRLAGRTAVVGDRVALFGGRLSPERDGVEGLVTRVREAPCLGSILVTTSPPGRGGSGAPVVGMDGEVVAMAMARPVEGGLLSCAIPAARIDALRADGFTKLADRPSAELDEDPARFLSGVRCLLAEDLEGAAKAFRAAADEDPADGTAWRLTAEALVGLGRGKEAVEAAQAAHRLEGDNPAATTALGRAYAAAGLGAEGIDACRMTVRLLPGDAPAWNRLGVACVEARKWGEAIEAFLQSLKIAPADGRVHKSLGVAYLGKGRFNEAVDSFREAVRLLPEYDRAWKDLGLAYHRLGAFEKAVEADLEAIRIRPEAPRVHNNLGVTYQALGRTEEAVHAYKEALRLRPRFGQAWANLAYAHLKLGRTEDATRAYQEAVAREPGNAEARVALGLLWMKSGKKAEAEQEVREAVRAEPKNARARFVLGQIFVDRGNRGEALEEYKALKELDRASAEKLFALVYR
jgi:tetratricopeptide (TPR) repeat protein